MQTASPIETTKNGKLQTALPQEILDLIWKEAWLMERVIVLAYRGFDYAEFPLVPERGNTLLLVYGNTRLNCDAGELVKTIRLVNTKARDTIDLLSRTSGWPSRDLARPSRAFRGQYVDFDRDVFWLSRDFINDRFRHLTFFKDEIIRNSPAQPSHMMLSLRHMLAMLEMVYIGATPCLNCLRFPRREFDILGDFHKLFQTDNGATAHAQTLSALIPQSIDECSGKVDYEALEHRPFGTSAEEKESVLELARGRQSNRRLIEQIYNYWSNLVARAEQDGVDLPTLQFSRRRS